jgi:hypothetical protein
MTKPKKAFWFLVTEPRTDRKARVKIWTHERARDLVRMFELQDYNCGPIGTVTDAWRRDDLEMKLAIDLLDTALSFEKQIQGNRLPAKVV